MPRLPKRLPLVFGDTPELRTDESLSGASGEDRGTYAFAMALAQIEELCLTLQRAVGVDPRLTVDPMSMVAVLTDEREGDPDVVDHEISQLEYLLRARSEALVWPTCSTPGERRPAPLRRPGSAHCGVELPKLRPGSGLVRSM